MNAAGYPGSPGEQPERELSAFELLGLVPAAPPAPVAPPPVASVPGAPVPVVPTALPATSAPASPAAAPLSRREARLREQGAAPAASTAQPYLPAVQPAPRPPVAVSPMPLQAALQPASTPPSAPAPVLSRRAERERAERAQPPTARLARRAPESSVRASRPAAHSGPPRKGFGARLLSFGAMVFAATMLIGLTVPANAFYGPEGSIADAVALDAEPVQSLSVGDNVSESAAERADYGVTSWAQILQQRYGSQSYDYTVGVGPIQWPFPFAVPISDGWGDRAAPCRGCSSYHQGIDFIPGLGQPIYAIADGVVTLHEPANWSYGNTIEIEHQIGGQVVTSKYAHMESGSTSLAVGQVVKVGDFIGTVGDTGVSTGPNLHFEVWIDTVKVNPFTWLKANAAS